VVTPGRTVERQTCGDREDESTRHPSSYNTRSTGGELNGAISRSVVRLTRQRVGRGPTRATAFYRDNIIVVVLRGGLTKAEQSLAAAGRGEAVLQMRRALQQAMRGDLTEIIEELTGCKVQTSMSANEVDADVAAELFVLDRPVPGSLPSPDAGGAS
jgi:uncharacterized protein YbcI